MSQLITRTLLFSVVLVLVANSPICTAVSEKEIIVAQGSLPADKSPKQARRDGLVAKYGTEVADAILAGNVIKGMTMEQVVLARGEPVRKEMIPPDAELWHYVASDVVFGEGKVSYVSVTSKEEPPPISQEEKVIPPITSFATPSVYGETLFFDNFNGPHLNPIWQAFLPNAPWRFGSAVSIFQGESNFSFQSLDGNSVIRLQNILGNAQRRGWSSSTSFPSDTPILYEARFNTLVQSSSTGIDELLEIWFLDSNNPDKYDIVALSAPGYGRDRVFTAGSSITNVGLDTNFPFRNNTWYRMIISGSKTQEVRASIYGDAATVELIGVNLGHNLGAYPSGFKIGISQSMGLPGSPFPTDVVLDSVRLTTAQTKDSQARPQPPTLTKAPAIKVGDTYIFESMDPDHPESGTTVTRRTVTSKGDKIVFTVVNLKNTKAKARNLYFNGEWNLLSTRNADNSNLWC